MNYQWSRNGVALAGQTSAVLTIAGVTATDLGDYSVTVANLCGSLSAGPFVLSAAAPAAPITPDITVMEFLKGNFQLTFATKEGQNYVVEYKDSLDDPVWTQLTTVIGDGQQQQVVDTPPLPNMRFYRARLALP